MPKIITKIEGRGNGIKTVVPNIVPIAEALNRKAAHIIRYFGMELGAIARMDEKTKIGTVHGAHNNDSVHDLLKKFIKAFVLCARCQNPETSMSVQGRNLVLKCSACGFSYNAPPANKLTNVILQDYLQEKKARKKEDGEGDDDENEDEEEEESKKKNKKIKKERPKKKDVEEAEEVGKVPSSSTSTNTEHPHQTFITSGTTATVLSPFLLEQQKIQEELRAKMKQPDHPIMELFDHLFPNAVSVEALENKENVDKLMIRKGEMGQFGILIALERLVGIENRKLLPDISRFISVLYQKDVLEEYKILLWVDNLIVSTSFGIPIEVAKEVREKATPFIEYLKEEEPVVPVTQIGDELAEEKAAEEEAAKKRLEAEINDL